MENIMLVLFNRVTSILNSLAPLVYTLQYVNMPAREQPS